MRSLLSAFSVGALCVVMLGGGPGEAAAQAGGSASTAFVIFGSDTIRAEVAQTGEQRARGLMFRNDVPEGTGMLFVFQRATVQDIWMKDTHVPLDVAFLDASFRIINIEALQPLDLTTKSSMGPALLALEVRQGWFEDHGIEQGDLAVVSYGRQ